jgi:uncharacterized membrane protein
MKTTASYNYIESLPKKKINWTPLIILAVGIFIGLFISAVFIDVTML